MCDGAVIAARILQSDGQPFTTLSLANGLPPVTISTAITDARRNYMRLAALIHPDKIKGQFEKATQAFQCLVKAFETFVDPKQRKRAAAALQKSKKQSNAQVKAESKKKRKDKANTQKRKTNRKVAVSEKSQGAKQDKSGEVAKRKKKTKQQQYEDEDDFVEKDSEQQQSQEQQQSDEDESQAGEGEDWQQKFLADDVEPAVSTSRTPIGIPRTGGVYTQTVIGCPNCRTRWEPDSKPQYSLFMGQWGKKVYCQLCLFVFGSASALHNCPHCGTSFDYDASMYDSTITCSGCKKQIGFPYYPVNQMLIDNLALEQWRARKEAQKIKERELRARQRHGFIAANHSVNNGSSSKSISSSGKARRAAESEEEMLTLVGTCVVQDECPLCHQRIKRNHRTHVEQCIKLTPEQRNEAKRTRKATTNESESKNQQNSAKKAVVEPTRKRTRTASANAKQVQNSVNTTNLLNTKDRGKQTAKLSSTSPSSRSSSSLAKASKSDNKQRNSQKRRRGKRNNSDDDDDDDEDESEEESFSEGDSEDDDESDEDEDITESEEDENESDEDDE